MSTSRVTLTFGDGTYTFCLRIREILELERLTESSIGEIATRLMTGVPRMRDIYDSVRLGLIGGGLPPTSALLLVENYIAGVPLADPRDSSSPMATAQAVVMAVWVGMEEVPDTLSKEEVPPAQEDSGLETFMEQGLPQG